MEQLARNVFLACQNNSSKSVKFLPDRDVCIEASTRFQTKKEKKNEKAVIRAKERKPVGKKKAFQKHEMTREALLF